MGAVQEGLQGPHTAAGGAVWGTARPIQKSSLALVRISLIAAPPASIG